MNHPQGTAAQASHHANTAVGREARHSPPECNASPRRNRVEPSDFDKLLTIDKTFYQTVSRQLAGHAACLGVPPSDLEDVVAETLLRAVQHRYCFAEAHAETRLHCWLMKVGHRIALDVLRRLDRHPCEALAAGEEEPIDEAESRYAEAAELREWLETWLEKASRGHEEGLFLLHGHYFQGLSLQELARRCGMTTKAVDGRIRRLLNKVRELLECTLHDGDAAHGATHPY